MTGSSGGCDSKLYDRESRRRKAAKIVTILEDFVGRERLASLRCLDMGCSAGLITQHLSSRFQTTVGLDLDIAATAFAQESNTNERVIYLAGDVAHLPFTAWSFDILVCAQVYEHVADQEALFRELWRVLRPGGVCFFSGPNRLAVLEEHYSLLFLSWFPRPLADAYTRITGRGDAYHEKPLTYWQLRCHLRQFSIHDYTVEMVKFPDRFSCSDEMSGRLKSLVSKLPQSILRGLIFLLPNYNWVLWKA